ncbi:Voltage-gated Ion Channel (VIC) Superfamily [Globisporangium polare]
MSTSRCAPHRSSALAASEIAVVGVILPFGSARPRTQLFTALPSASGVYIALDVQRPRVMSWCDRSPQVGRSTEWDKKQPARWVSARVSVPKASRSTKSRGFTSDWN